MTTASGKSDRPEKELPPFVPVGPRSGSHLCAMGWRQFARRSIGRILPLVRSRHRPTGSEAAFGQASCGVAASRPRPLPHLLRAPWKTLPKGAISPERTELQGRARTASRDGGARLASVIRPARPEAKTRVPRKPSRVARLVGADRSALITAISDGAAAASDARCRVLRRMGTDLGCIRGEEARGGCFWRGNGDSERRAALSGGARGGHTVRRARALRKKKPPRELRSPSWALPTRLGLWASTSSDPKPEHFVRHLSRCRAARLRLIAGGASSNNALRALADRHQALRGQASGRVPDRRASARPTAPSREVEFCAPARSTRWRG